MGGSSIVFSDGEAYEKMMGRWSRLAGEEFLSWIAPKPGQTWLDVGCGNGAFSELLAEECHPKHITGIDPSEGQLEFARSRIDSELSDFNIGSAIELPYADNEFNATTMALAINFVPEAALSVSEMVRVTKAGGSISTYMWDIDNGGFTMEPFRLALQKIGVQAPIPGANVVKIENLERLWNEAGLANVQTRVIDIILNYTDFDEFWNANTGIANSVSNAIAKLKPDEVEQVKYFLMEIVPPKSDGQIVYGAFANAVKGNLPT